jgi:hypothetical protein
MMDGRMEGVARLYDFLHSEAWVTTKKGKISRQDLDLSEGKNLKGRVTNLFEGESGEVLVFEGAILNTRALDATMVDALKASYPWKQTTLERDGSFRVTGLDLESYTRFTVIVSTSSGRFAASQNGLRSGEVIVNGERIERRFSGAQWRWSFDSICPIECRCFALWRAWGFGGVFHFDRFRLRR